MSAVVKPLCTDVELGEIFQISDRRVRQLVTEKVLVKVGGNAYDTLSSIRAYLKYKSTETGSGTEGYEKARERLTLAKAEKAEIETAIVKGAAHDGQLVEKFWADMIQNAKTKLLAMPKSAAAQCAGETNPAVIETLLTDAVRAALNELAAYDAEQLIQGFILSHSENVGTAAEADGEPVG